MKLKNILITVLTLVGMNTWAQQTKDPILGKWTGEKGERIFEIIQNSQGSYDAIVRKASNDKLIGKKQFTNLKASTDNTYKDGTIHLISKGKTGSCSAKMLDNTTLEIKGKIGMFSSSVIWKKI